MRAGLVLAVALVAAPARAEPISPSEFEALSQGRTLYFVDQSQGFGAEQYFPNRRVRWMYRDGECTDGYWYPLGQQLCFVYDHAPDPQCWLMTREGGQISARRAEYEDTTPIFVDRIDDRPLACAGPDLGV